MIQFEHFETANDIMIRFSSAPKNKLQTTKPDRSLNSDRYTATTKYTDKLADNYDFMPKVVALDDAQRIIDIVNETAQKYGQYYQQHDAWNHEADNLTHRPGTPWSIAHAKGQNALLSDDDILKYHALERL